jgi:hypothetical protein
MYRAGDVRVESVPEVNRSSRSAAIPTASRWRKFSARRTS